MLRNPKPSLLFRLALEIADPTRTLFLLISVLASFLIRSSARADQIRKSSSIWWSHEKDRRLKMLGWEPEDAIPLVSNNAPHRRIASTLRPHSPDSLPDRCVSQHKFRSSSLSILIEAIVIPSVQSPSGFSRALRVLPTGCDARPVTLYYPAMDNQFTAPDDCAMDNQLCSQGRWMG
jgi:hypothetical protein